jgi:hypothetical protein
MGRAVPDIPDGMRRVQAHFGRWRESHAGRLPIPEALWAEAAELAREHGVFRTAKVLRLEYGKLKRLAASSSPSPVSRKVARLAAPPAAFMELLAPGTSGVSECLIEMEGPRGKLRIQWKGATAADLAGFSRVWWESA